MEQVIAALPGLPAAEAAYAGLVRAGQCDAAARWMIRRIALPPGASIDVLLLPSAVIPSVLAAEAAH